MIIKIFGKPKKTLINNLSIADKKFTDTSYILLNYKNFLSEIFLSYASVKYKKIEIIFSNCIIVLDEGKLAEYHPRNLYDNKGLFKLRKVPLGHRIFEIFLGIFFPTTLCT